MTDSAHELFEEQPETSGSIKDKLQARRVEIADNRTYDLDIPGYNGDLYAVYKLLDGQRLNQIAQTVSKTTRDRAERGITAAIDTLVVACKELRVRDEGRDLSVSEVAGLESEVRYDSQLAAFLGFSGELSDTPTAREVLRKVFVDNEIAIAAHNQRLSRWMMGNGVSLDEELLEDFG